LAELPSKDKTNNNEGKKNMDTDNIAGIPDSGTNVPDQTEQENNSNPFVCTVLD